MNILKYLAQIVASIVYSNLFTGLMYLIIVLPIAWVLSLPWWGILLVIVLGGGIIEGIISLLQVLGIMPYTWIVKNNTTALVLSILIILFNLGRSTFVLWKSLIGQGTLAIILAIVFTGLIIQLVFSVIPALITFKNEER